MLEIECQRVECQSARSRVRVRSQRFKSQDTRGAIFSHPPPTQHRTARTTGSCPYRPLHRLLNRQLYRPPHLHVEVAGSHCLPVLLRRRRPAAAAAGLCYQAQRKVGLHDVLLVVGDVLLRVAAQLPCLCGGNCRQRGEGGARSVRRRTRPGTGGSLRRGQRAGRS